MCMVITHRSGGKASARGLGTDRWEATMLPPSWALAVVLSSIAPGILGNHTHPERLWELRGFLLKEIAVMPKYSF